jgi:hypothetical protein
MKKGKVNDLVNLDIYNLCALFISCMVHDFKHPGLTNAFLVNTNDEIAIRYNDKSVLESYHIAQTFELIKNKPKCDIFKDMNKSEIAMMRKRMINCVLSTDMVKHAQIFSLIKVSTEKYKINQGKNAYKFFEGLESMALFEMQQNFMDLFIHSCDISNPTKPYDIYQIWATNVMNEFYLQGDREKKMGLPVSFLCDRDTTTIPQGQIGFMEGVVLPFYSSVVNIFPGLDYSIKNLNFNKAQFIKMKEEDEKAKKENKDIITQRDNLEKKSTSLSAQLKTEYELKEVYNQKISSLNTLLSNLKIEYNKLQEQKGNKDEDKSDIKKSEIINSIEAFDIEKKTKGIIIDKCFDGPKNNYSPEIFHEKCDKSPLLLLIKTEDNKRLGAFIQVSSDGLEIKKDIHSFLINIDESKYFNLASEDYTTIVCDPKELPQLGVDLKLKTNGQGIVYFPYHYGKSIDTKKDFYMENQFNIAKLEIYKVKI